MSAELLEPLSAPDTPQGVLEDLHASQDDFEQFFGDVFDELQSLSLELFARHKCLEVTAGRQEGDRTAAAENEKHFQRLFDELQQARAEFRAGREEAHDAWAHWNDAQQASVRRDAQLIDLQQQIGRISGEIRAAQEELRRQREELRDTQQKAESHLARLAGIATELAETQNRSAEHGDTAGQQQFQEMLEDSRQREALWYQQRAALEAELEKVRGRAAELGESLAEQRRQAVEQQSELAGELRRMRSMLETIAAQMRRTTGSGQGDATEDPVLSAVDPVLDSVLAQFEMLQSDVARRRTGTPRNNH